MLRFRGSGLENRKYYPFLPREGIGMTLMLKVHLYLLLLWVVVTILTGIWMYKAKPGKNITGKYPKKIIRQLERPFNKSWRNYIDKDDLSILQTYRKRIIIFYSLYMILFLVYILWPALIYLLLIVHVF